MGSLATVGSKILEKIKLIRSFSIGLKTSDSKRGRRQVEDPEGRRLESKSKFLWGLLEEAGVG